MTPARQRDGRIDSLRAVAILAVVLGHAITAVYGRPTAAPGALGVVFTLCATLGVPLFMFLAGWVARPDAGVAWVRGRVGRLLVPYAAWVFVQFLLWDRAGGLSRLFELLAHPRETNALWFLPALFLCSAAFAVLRRWDPLLIAVAVAAMFLVPPVPFFDLPRAAAQFPFFVAGHYASRLRVDLRPFALLSPLAFAAAWSRPAVGLQWATPAWSAKWGVAASAAGIPAAIAAAPLRLAHVMAPLGLVALAFVVAGCAHGRDPRRDASAGALVGNAWRWLGANTLGVYLGHIYFLRLHVGPGLVGVTTSFLAALAGGAALTLLLRMWQPAAFVLLGVPATRSSAPAAAAATAEAG